MIQIVHIDRLIDNIHYYKSKCDRLCMVVKADAYGHGYEICRYAERYVDYFAVGTVYEGEILRQLGVKLPILVLSYSASGVDILNRCHLEPIVYTVDMLRGIDKSVPLHLGVDTGMHRIGVRVDEAMPLSQVIYQMGYHIEAVCSHIYSAESTQIQCSRLKDVLSQVRDIYPHVYSHIESSGSIEAGVTDMARIGLGIYTHTPIMEMRAEILHIAPLHIGESAGYDGVYVADQDKTIAIVGCGYADGVLRRDRQGGYVVIDNKRAYILAVCMDSIIVDITNIPCRVGDFAYIVGEGVTVQDIAKIRGTIPYEVMTSFGTRRLRRTYSVDENNSRDIQG